jgi:lactate permease
VILLRSIFGLVAAVVLLYNITVRTGNFGKLSLWLISHLPRDRRIVLIVLGFSFNALLESVACAAYFSKAPCA